MSGQLSGLAKGTAIYGIGQALNRMMALLLLPLFTAYLTPGDYGVISILSFVSFLIIPLFGLGFGASMGIVYFEGDNETRKSKTVWTALSILFASSFVVFLLTVLFSRQISMLVFKSDRFGYELICIVVTSIFNGIMIQPLQSRLQFEQKAVLFTVLNTASALLVVALNVLFVVKLRMGVNGWLLGGAIGAVVSFIAFLVVVIRTTTFSVETRLARELLRLGLPIIPSLAFLFITQHSGRYMLQWERGLEQVGIYTIGFNFGIMTSLAVGAFTTAWYSYFNSFVSRQDECGPLFSRIMTYYLFISGVLSLLFFAFAKPVVMLFTQDSFHSAYEVVGMVALAQCLIGTFSILLPGCYFAKEVKIINVVQFFACLIALAANFLLIPRYGMHGAAAAVLLGFMAMPLLQLGVNRWRGYLRIDYEYRRILTFVVMFTAFLFVTYLLDTIGSMTYFLIASAAEIVLFIGCVTLLLNRPEKVKLIEILKAWRLRFIEQPLDKTDRHGVVSLSAEPDQIKVFSGSPRIQGSALKVLVLYHQQYEQSIRKTIKDHLYSFRQCSNESYRYLNVAGGIPAYIGKIGFDLVIYHYTICACRFQPGFFDRIDTKWERLKSLQGYKIAIPQDEHFKTNDLCRFFRNFGISTVCTCLPEQEWHKVYPEEKSGVDNFVAVLTGYVDERAISLLPVFEAGNRDIDVGYRARKNSYSLGCHDTIKWRIAELFNGLPDRRGLCFDISTDPADVFYGDDWHRFLCRCRTILGCEGGASLHDPDGSIELCVQEYLAKHPSASFQEVEEACFSGLDGNLELFALSPRHFEACVTKTCQVLVEGQYGGVFLPGVHYIELKKDWSNIDEVMSRIADHQYCSQIAENAYRDIVGSGAYTYRKFVDTVIGHARTVMGDVEQDAADGYYWSRLGWREKFQVVFLVPSFFIALLRGPLRMFFEAVGCADGYEKLKRIIQR
jgi:O-antigen/teichoic acid export membrane protein